MYRSSAPLLLGLLLLLAACDSDSDPVGPPPVPTITGTWAGEVTSAGTPLRVEMDLTEVDSEVGGQGTIDVAQDSTLSYTVQGSHVHPLVSLELTFDRPPLGTLSGSVNDERDRIDGTMSGPGFAGEVELTLRRVQAPTAAP